MLTRLSALKGEGHTYNGTATLQCDLIHRHLGQAGQEYDQKVCQSLLTLSVKWRWPHHHPHLKKTKNHCIFWSLGFAFIMLLCSYYIIYYCVHIRSTSYVFYFYVPSQNAQQTVPSVFHEDQSRTTLTFNSVQLLLQTVCLQMWVIRFLSARGREGFQFETGRRV